MATVGKLFEYLLPKKKNKAGGTSTTVSYNPARTTEALDLPEYTDHLTELKNTRITETSLEIIKELMRSDPDVSGATSAYLTLADTEMRYSVTDSQGKTSSEGQKILRNILYKLFEVSDYSLGYQSKPSLSEYLTNARYMLLMRGAIGTELVFDKAMQPYELRLVDMATVKYIEKKPGELKPVQKTDNSDEISLDIPTFATARFKQDPTNPYSYSYFTPAINTIAARQVVINDLYRIMRITGYPRITLKVLEAVATNRAPAETKNDPQKLNDYLNTVLRGVANSFSNLRPDMPFAHTDGIEPSILNDKQPGAGLQVSEIIETLNAQNQAGLKVVATVLGRGTAGVNTASVESRIFSTSADSLNKPLASNMSRQLTLGLRLAGFDGIAEVWFAPAELRPELELEPMKLQKQSRLHKDLSLGIISDEMYYMDMYGETPEEGVTKVSGTGFDSKIQINTPDPDNTKKDSSIGRDLTPEGDKNADSKAV